MPAPTLIMQTTYAELLERCEAAAFQGDFPEDGTFTPKKVKGRTYWYFQETTAAARVQRYVGPETPALLDRIASHKQARDDERERRALVSALVRSFGMPRPLPGIGEVIAALARAGVFRLRGVLIGTIAYQTYSAMLGVRLPNPTLQTGDIDIAQFKSTSAAVGDQIPPLLDVLKAVDPTFRAVPHVGHRQQVTSYQAKGGLRVDILTPNQGAETDSPQPLPAFQTDAQPLRFLDFLIHDPERAVVLHEAGIFTLVPAPERYAIHKLIVARRRRTGAAKREKDIQQADALLNVLHEKRPHELRAAWSEVFQRGKKWRQLVVEGMLQLSPRTRDLTLKTLGERRAILPGLDLTFDNPPGSYDFDRDVVAFAGSAGGHRVAFAISREALDDHFGETASAEERISQFLENRSKIESVARAKYLASPIEMPEAILIRTEDVSNLA